MPGSSSPAATLVGRFLVAAPSMPDERFQKSVVFICKHDDDGKTDWHRHVFSHRPKLSEAGSTARISVWA